VILISSGFDAANGDPLGGFTITPHGYYYMTKKIL
jgi:histone deacetylase 6